MTSASPPYPWFSGITYNPSFFASSSTGDLTKAQANALYLRKTVPDIATALETFNSGIQTNNVDSIGNDLYLNSSNTLNIGTLTSPVLNMVTQNSSTSIVNIKTGTFTTGDVNICTGNGRAGVLHLGDGNNLLAGSGTHLNNGTFNASNTNIANGDNTSGSVNILSGVSSTGTINLGQITGTVTINVNRPLTPLYTAAPASTHIGYIYTLPLPTFPVTFGASPNTRTFTIALGVNTTGVWGIYATASINCTANGTITSYKLYINSSGVTVANQQYIDKVMTTGNPILTTNVSAVAYGPSNSITLTQEIVYTGAFQSSATNFNFSIVRIA